MSIRAGAFVGASVLSDEAGDIVPIILNIEYRSEGQEHNRELRFPAERLNSNAMRWDDDRKVAAMVTSIQSPLIMAGAGSVLATLRGLGGSGIPDNFAAAWALFRAMKESDLVYRVDPATPYETLSADRSAIDFLQFPVETLSYGSGDCDDLSVLYASFLEAAGIPIAFITIPGHIYAAFDSGLNEDQAAQLFPDKNLLIVDDGRVWIPLETTLLEKDFVEAWETGAEQWRRHSLRGDAELIVTSRAWRVYPPAEFPDGNRQASLSVPPGGQLAREFDELRSRHMESFIESAGLDRPDNRREYNRRGIIRGNGAEEREYLERARQIQPDNAELLLALAVSRLADGEADAARELYRRVQSLDGELARRNPLFADEPAAAGGTRAGGENSALNDYRDFFWSE